MSSNTVAEFAAELKKTPAMLLDQLKTAGVAKVSPTDALTEAQAAAMFERIPAGRFGEGGDVAAAALWLASDEGAYVTGQTIHVNGGMYMG